MKRSIKHIYVGIISLLCIGGMSACGESRTPDFKKETLSSPEGLYLSIRYSEEQTDYVLTWETVENSAGYEISIDGAAVATLEGFYVDEYDVTEHVQTGKSYEFGIKALGDEQDYDSSETATTQATAEEVTEKLLYTPLEDEDGACEVKADGDLNGKVVIPDEYNGWIVTKIAEYAFYEPGFVGSTNGIKEVRIPESIRRIGSYAFYASSFTEISLPSGIEEIGEWAFAECPDMVKFNIPSGVTVLSRSVLGGCRSLNTIELHDNITEIGGRAFCFCLALSEISIPKSVKKIEGDAFVLSGLKEIRVAEENEAYKSVDGNLVTKDGKTFVYYASKKPDEVYSVPIGVTKIGAYAFTDLYSSNIIKQPTFNLKKVILPQGVTDIEPRAFYGSGIREIEMPVGLKTIGKEAFRYCEDLEKATIPSGLESIGDQAFLMSGIKSIVIPDSVTEIGAEVFRQCPSLESVVLPKGLKKLKKGLFNQCKVLKSIVIPESVTEIEEEVFVSCQALERVELPEAITIIKESTFRVCKSLKEIILPARVTKIEKEAFRGCYSLVSVVIPKALKEVGQDAFTNCGALKNIFYEGTKTDWEEITFAEPARTDFPEVLLGWQNATRYYYSESEPPLSEDGTAYDGNYWYYDENGVPMVWTKEENGAQE